MLGLNLFGHYIGTDYFVGRTSYGLYLFVNPEHTQSVGWNRIVNGHITPNEVTGRFYQNFQHIGLFTQVSRILGETLLIDRPVEYGAASIFGVYNFKWDHENVQNEYVLGNRAFIRLYSSVNRTSGIMFSTGPSIYLKGTHPLSLDISISLFIKLEILPGEPQENYPPKPLD